MRCYMREKGAGAVTEGANNVIVEVDSLKMYFPITRGLLKKKVGEIKAVDGVSFTIKQGETLGLVGESGCGKTTVGRCLCRVYTPSAGRIWFKGREISSMPENEFRPLRHEMAIIFQDPYSSLDPRQTAGGIVGEPLKIHNMVQSKAEYDERVAALFAKVGLDPDLRSRYPHEFSGGQRQRIGIARALAGEPSLIICDEPVSALDVSIQAQIINLLMDLQGGFGPALVRLHRARSLGGETHQRPHRRDVPGPYPGDHDSHGALRQSYPSLHAGPAVGGLRARPGHRGYSGADHHAGRGAEPGQSALGLRAAQPVP